MKSKHELKVPKILQDQSKASEGLYTADEIKAKARSLLIELLKGQQSTAILQAKPKWDVLPINTVSAAALEVDEEMFEQPAGPWSTVFETFSSQKNEILVSFDLARERANLTLPGGKTWTSPMHLSVFEAVIERASSALELGENIEEFLSGFLPGTKGITFYIYSEEEFGA